MNETTQPAVAGPVEPTVRQPTPGPWKAHFEEAYFVTGPDLGRVAMMMNLKGAHGLGGRRSGAEAAANCRLIAAAPDMLEALRKAVALLAGVCVHSPELEPYETYEAVSAAIAKATGCAAERRAKRAPAARTKG